MDALSHTSWSAYAPLVWRQVQASRRIAKGGAKVEARITMEGRNEPRE